MSQDMSSSSESSSSEEQSDSSLQSRDPYHSYSDDRDSSRDDSEECSTDCDGCRNCIGEVSSHIPSKSCLYWDYSWSDVALTSCSFLTLSPGFIQLPQHVKAIRLGVGRSSYCRNEINFYCYLNHHEKLMGWVIWAVACFYEPDKFVELITRVKDGLGGELLVASIASHPEDDKVVTLKFRIYLAKHTGPYDYHLRDMRLGEDLWETAMKQHMTDVVFLVGDRSFPAHKFLLAARSPVFAVMFGTDMVESRTGRVKVDDADPDIFHEFLRFLYTGQLERPVSEELAIIADKYDVKTLTVIRNDSSFTFGVNAEELFASVCSAKAVDKKSIFLLDPDERVAASFWSRADVSITEDPLAVCKEGGQCMTAYTSIYEKWSRISGAEPHFFQAGVLMDMMPDQICLSSLPPDQEAFRIVEVFYRSNRYSTKDDFNRSFTRMKPLYDPAGSEDAEPAMQEFIATLRPSNLPRNGDNFRVPVQFKICLTPTIPEFRYDYRDWYLPENLWKSSVNKEWTDIDFLVGGQAFSAHRALLAARCPALIPPGPNDSSSQVRIENVEASVFKDLLHFLYTGERGVHRAFTPSKALYEAALTYQVDLLKRLYEMRHPKEDADSSSDCPVE